MDSIKSDAYRTKGSFTETKKFSNVFWSMGGEEFLKLIVTYFYFTKYNEMNIVHSVVQKHVLYTGSHKRFLVYYGLCLVTAGYVF